jgi:hypothetical protein
MNNEKLFEFYEKLYFHEVEARESIANRLQMPLAILMSMLTLYAYLLQGLSLNSSNLVLLTFFFSLLCSIYFFVKSSLHFRDAFFGSTYELLPTAAVSEEYRQTLLKQYESFTGKGGKGGSESCDVLVCRYFSQYLYERYIRTTTNNSNVNDLRAHNLHMCNSYIIKNTLPLLITFLLFSFGGLNKSEHEKEVNVVISKPVKLEADFLVPANNALLPSYTLDNHNQQSKESLMNTPVNQKSPPTKAQTPPAPAKQPDPRYIREGVEPKITPPTK